jgi:hypothetical protein
MVLFRSSPGALHGARKEGGDATAGKEEAYETEQQYCEDDAKDDEAYAERSSLCDGR